MKDLGQEALDEMNRLLLNQKQLKMKLEKMGNYGESATIKNQIADLSKKVERLQKQLKEANEAIKITNRVSGNIDLSQMVYEDRRKVDGITMQTGSYLEKWGVK